MTILLVGDKPSKHNISPYIAFVGTKSHKTLLEWCNIMHFKMPEFANRIDLDINARLVKAKLFAIPVVALGNESARFLAKTGIEFFKLPHPSGLNRKLNDKLWLFAKLHECASWANSFSTGGQNAK